MTPDDGGTAGGPAGRLRSLADRIEAQFGPGVVERDEEPTEAFSVQPRAGSCPLYVMVWGDELIFGMGTGACRWELSQSEADIDFIEAMVEAAILGRVSEVFAPGRSRVTVHRLDGTTARTGQADVPKSCLPIPFWTRSKRRRTDYVPY